MQQQSFKIKGRQEEAIALMEAWRGSLETKVSQFCSSALLCCTCAWHRSPENSTAVCCSKDTGEVVWCWTKWGFRYQGWQESIIENFLTFLYQPLETAQVLKKITRITSLASMPKAVRSGSSATEINI